MKKKICAFAASAALCMICTAANVGAASYTIGTKQDFESTINTGTDYITRVNDEKYGGVLKFSSDSNTNGGEIVFDFSEGVTEGKWLLSFDALMSSTKANMLIFTNNYANGAWNNITFMALREGGGVTAYPNNQWAFPQIGDARFEANTWHRYDLVMEFDINDKETPKFGELYMDGVYKGDVNLTENNINAMKKIHFVFADYTKSGYYALLDNLQMQRFTSSATMTAKRNTEGEFEVEFSETMPALSKSSFKLTKTSLETGSESDSDFSVKYTTPTKAVLVADKLKDGYSYTLSLADGITTAFGNEISDKSFTVEIPKSIEIDKEWNFEDGISPGGNTEIADFENRGKTLKYTDSADVNFTIDEALSQGTYIYSFDMMRESVSDANYMFIRAYNANSKWRYFEALYKSRYFGAANSALNASGGDDGWGIRNDKRMTDGEWYRIDNVMDMNAKVSYLYCDGEYLGSIDLAAKDLNEFKGAMMSVTGKNAYFDNIRIRNVSDTYGAKLSADGNKLYIDFDETTLNLTDDSFEVMKSDSPFSHDAETVGATLIYQNGARAVLQLDKDAKSGEIYEVIFNDVTSFMGSTLSGPVLCSVSSDSDAAIGRAEFVTVTGESSTALSVSSATEKMIIQYPTGMSGNEFNGSLEITCGDEAVPYQGEWDSETNTYTVTFDSLLGANKAYYIKASGSVDAAGNTYIDTEGSFVTGEELNEFTELDFEKTASGIDVRVQCVNTSADAEYYVVWTGYNGALKNMDYMPVSFAKDDRDTIREISFDDSDIASYDKVSVYIWKSFSDIMPIRASVTK